MLTESLKLQIRQHALTLQTQEVCGIVTNEEAITLTNIAPDPSADFACVVDRECDAVYHSHWSDMQPGELSLEDIERCKKLGIPYILHHTATNVWDYYDPKSPNPFPLTLQGNPSTLSFYLGWRFVWGRSDCFGLIRCYFLGMHNIDIGDFKRPTRKEQRTFPQPEWVASWKAEENSFVQLPRGSDVQPNDVIEIAQRGGTNSNHIAVIVNQSEMLHSPSMREVSKIEAYSEYWQLRTTKHFRHQNFI